MNFPTEVVTPKEIAHYLLFTRWHHFWGQIRTWDKSEKNQAEAELADALESYAESFRNKPAVISADARGWAERVDALYREYGQYVNVSMIAALLDSFRAETVEGERDHISTELAKLVLAKEIDKGSFDFVSAIKLYARGLMRR